ncbi:MAG: type I restriction enzyme S subunit [Psychroserpens sp.]|jgi:type I restriction enzyme S subunit
MKVVTKQILVPEIRFPEFEEKWCLKLLSELFTFKNGVNASKEDYGSGYKFINVLDIIENDFITHDKIIGEVNISEEIFRKFIVEYGDVLFQRSSETREEVGQANVYLDKKSPATFGGFVIRGKQKEEYNPSFMNALLKTSRSRKEITTKSGGSTRYNVGQETLSSVKIYTTKIEEQQKIASFLTSVDKKIQQLTKKTEDLEQFKKGVMQQIFKQELRFKDDTGNDFPKWKNVGGNVLFDSISDKKHNSDLPILAITQDKGAIPRDLIDYNISVTEKSVDSYKVVQIGDFVISLRSFQGGIEYSNYKGICSPAYIILRPSSENVDRTFYKYYLKTSNYIKQLQKNLEGIRDGKMISYKYFSEIKLPFPSIGEQKKIASFLTTIDKKIAQANTQLAETQQFKKGLLQQMFV